MKILKKIFLWLLVLMLIVVGAFLHQGYVSYQDAIEKVPIENMKSEIQSQCENYVSLDEISDDFKHAIIAVEDHRFYERYGYDYVSIIRALYSTLILGNVQGGSTIPQQLIKNFYYDYHSSLVRKFAELFFQKALSNVYTKDEILEMYLNIIYYGDGYTGVEDASMGYFGKDASELNLFEGSLLAGIINAPSVYCLSSGCEKALERQKTVLSSMVTYGYITSEEMNAVLEEQDAFLELIQ